MRTTHANVCYKAMIEDLKAKSARWEDEQQSRSLRNKGLQQMRSVKEEDRSGKKFKVR
jgi:hypothetical protein